MLKVIAYTGGNAPSGFFRAGQYQKPLRCLGVDLRECRSTAGVFPPLRRWLRPAWGVWNLIDRAPDTLRSYGYDLVFLQREMLSTFVTWEPFTKRPRVLDVDDAIWVHRRGDFAKRLARMCDHVICGNQFLAEQFSQWNPNVVVVATPVDTSIFSPVNKSEETRHPIIGWMGLPSNLVSVYAIERALAAVLKNNPRAILRIVSSRRPQFRLLPAGQVEHIAWSREREAQTMQEMDIGIMPLDDTIYGRGKCSFKMLLYMACGLPVVVSPVGMNVEVLAQGGVGFGPRTEQEWIENLNELLANPTLAHKMGKAGREIVVNRYSVQALAPLLAETLLRVAGKDQRSASGT